MKYAGTMTRMPYELAMGTELSRRQFYDRAQQAADRIEAQHPDAPAAEPFSLSTHLQRQRDWSERTFGPGSRTAGVLDHIRKELHEIEQAPTDLSEWIDVVILALDGAWRAGYSPDQIIAQLVAKQTKNEGRIWPDWRTAPEGKAIEHDRELSDSDWEAFDRGY